MTPPTTRPPTLTIRPLTPDLWPALEDLFSEHGAVGGCWCMYWRIGNDYRRQPPDLNRTAFRQVVLDGPPPGLLAFLGDLPVGWCQVTPRHSLPWLEHAWRNLDLETAGTVWSLSCLYIRKGWRRLGITSALITAALQTAQAAGASALEAYPLDAALTPSASGTGFVSTFTRLGFRVTALRSPSRPVMRFDFRVEDIDTHLPASRDK